MSFATAQAKPRLVVVNRLLSGIDSATHSWSPTPLDKNEPRFSGLTFNERLPAIGSTVWCRVIRVAAKFVQVDILMAEPPTEGIYRDSFKGQIRSATE